MMGDTILCPHCYTQTTLLPFEDTRLEQLKHQTELVVLKESASAYERAEHLDDVVAARLSAASSKPVPTTKVENFKQRSAEVEQVLNLLRHPQTARQVVLASMILGPAKANE